MTTRKAKATADVTGATVREGAPRVPRDRGTFWVPGDSEAVRPLVRGEGMPVFVAAVLLALIALAFCYRHGYTLLYGDAVAHLGNARRILDSHYPGLSQLGGVWLPLPHVLMLPFIGNMNMWQTGLAAAPMSMLSFAASVVGVWRLSRRTMRLRWALVATTFYALNPNLLYAATTALTEALFLGLFVWSVVGVVECVAALRVADAAVARRRMVFTGVMVLLEVFTRYDGWVMGAAAWCCLAWAVWRCTGELRRRVLPAFGVFTLLCVAGPVLWLWYNAHFDGDWLDFLRGPYSAKAIERKTSHPGQHYPGWRNPLLALVYFTRAAQIDAAVWEFGFGLMAAAVCGVWLSWRGSRLSRDEGLVDALQPRSQKRDVGHPAKKGNPGVAKVRRAGAWERAEWTTMLLWAPLPFYVYSIAYGAVPIFIPQLPPHAFYNARYGMELLPALCVYPALAAERLEVWLRSGVGSTASQLGNDEAVAKGGHSALVGLRNVARPVLVGRAGGAYWRERAARFWQPAAMAICALNSLLMMAGFGSAGFLRGDAVHRRQRMEAYKAGYLPAARRWAYPLLLQEGLVNAQTRVPFEQSVARALEELPQDEPVLMSVTAHVGAVQVTGRTLRSMVSEGDEKAWAAALADPAHHAAYVVAMEGDPVARAVAEHPEGLAETEVIRSSGQPVTRVYQSVLWKR